MNDSNCIPCNSTRWEAFWNYPLEPKKYEKNLNRLEKIISSIVFKILSFLHLNEKFYKINKPIIPIDNPDSSSRSIAVAILQPQSQLSILPQDSNLETVDSTVQRVQGQDREEQNKPFVQEEQSLPVQEAPKETLEQPTSLDLHLANEQEILAQSAPLTVVEEKKEPIVESYPVVPESIRMEQLAILQSWLDQYQSDYIAHAVWPGNIGKIIERGAILPAEAVLKELQSVEYEKGSTFGSRGTRQLIDLKDDIREIFEKLTPEEEVELEKLKEKEKTGLAGEEWREFKNLKKEIAKQLDKRDQERLEWAEYSLSKRELEDVSKWKKVMDQLMAKGAAKLSSDQLARYELLSAKNEHFTIKERNELKRLKNKKNGFLYQFNRMDTSIETRGNGLFNRNQELKKLRRDLTTKEREELKRLKNLQRDLTTTEREELERLKKLEKDADITTPVLSYYLRNEDKIYPYLTHKYEQWLSKGVSKKDADEALTIARDGILNVQSEKLNLDIRATRNGIRWSYGRCVLLRGKAEAIINAQSGSEAMLLAPWQNKGQYFTLPLVEEHTILLGPQKDLEPYAETLNKQGVKFVYLESLTKEQAEFFKVPT